MTKRKQAVEAFAVVNGRGAFSVFVARDHAEQVLESGDRMLPEDRPFRVAHLLEVADYWTPDKLGSLFMALGGAGVVGFIVGVLTAPFMR